MKLAIFDFCDTIVNFQTADRYVEYTGKKLGIEMEFNELLQDEKVNSKYQRQWMLKKQKILDQLKGLNKKLLVNTARDFYDEQIVPELNSYIVNSIKSLRENDYKTIIISSGYSIYIDYFATEYNVNKVIANDFLYEKDIFEGKITRKDCYGEEKVKRLKEYINNMGEITDSVSYSDSISDIPILKFAKRAVVVSKTTYRSWPQDYGFEQVVLYS